MTTTLDACADLFRSGRARIDALAGGLPPQVANCKPAADVWSVAEVVVHLNTLAADYLPALEHTVAAALVSVSPPEALSFGLLGGVFVRLVGPAGRPVKTPAAMRPPQSSGTASALDAVAALATFDADTDRFLGVIERARGVDAARVRVASPFLPMLRLPLAAFLAGLGGHIHRHADQIERVLAETRT
ncbi:MAG TPA: DinB family protein [Rubricoccaceae bacterium]|jgi:hypothetical protein